MEPVKIWLLNAGILLAAAAAGYLMYWILERLEPRIFGPAGGPIRLVRRCGRPLQWILPLLWVYLLLPATDIPERIAGPAEKGLRTALIFLFAWLAVRMTYVLEDIILRKYDIEAADNLQARKIHTQFRVIRKIVALVVGVIALSSVLMGFERFRELGAGILASAGIAGLALGLGARTILSNLLAGVQIAMTQPIRIDDAVLVENEWGRVEEITLTYVVVRIWDLRRLVLPIGYFIEKPFQNWTRTTASIIGSVHIHADYTLAVQAVREEFFRLLENTPRWDGQVRALQVINANERAMELRAIMSAPNSPTAWDLRCEIREKLIDFIRREFPAALPKLRVAPESGGVQPLAGSG